MIEIQIGANQIKKLSSEGLPNTKLLIQNQGRDVMYIFKSVSAPTLSAPALDLFHWQSIEVDNSSGDIWVGSQQDGVLFATPSTDISRATIDFPPELITSTAEGYGRVRVDQGQTGFFEGREFRTFYEFNLPANNVQTLKFVSTVNFMLFEQSLSVDAGSVRLEAFINATEIATFNTHLPVIGKNRMTTRLAPFYTSQIAVTTHATPVALGSSINTTGATRTDLSRVVASNSTAQQQSVSGGTQSERGLPAGTYYVRLHNFGNGNATGVYSLIWEERP